MSSRPPVTNTTANLAVISTAVPFFISIAMLGVKYNVGPQALLMSISQLGGFVLFGLIIIGSALIFATAMQRDGKRGWQIPLSLVLLVLSIVNVLLFT